MDQCIQRYKKAASESDAMTSLLGMLVIVAKASGYSFAARLIELRDCAGKDQECWFENKTGLRFMVRRSQIVDIHPLHTKSLAERR